ncbi:DinB family protein [Chitinophaga horti]|uniref:DinB family protein n=1 Tax=Chitinophaga horti TaxID=2920382 RepID=A0ABY6J4C4_9BACT|nr:DinB family protein [Chitinophaga horti]UYQ94523.1 DinB family protein [Chitinophaga horti]
MQKELAQQAAQAVAEMGTTFALFAHQKVNEVPFAGSWTPAQVVEHTLLSAEGCIALLDGDTSETTRDATAHVQELRDMFLNFDIKMQSPPDIVPPDTTYDKAALTDRLNTLRKTAERVIAARDLSRTCTTFEFPTIGYLTGLEVANFFIVHTQRHAHQLKNIYGAMVQ